MSRNEEAPQQDALTVVDDATVKELYANKLISTMFDGGALSITMGVTRFVPEQIEREPKGPRQPQVHVTTRLTLSPAGAIELTKALTNILSSMSKVAASRLEEKAAAKAGDVETG